MVLVRFNIKNAKYALETSSGWGAFVPFGYADSLSLEADYAEKVIYGDGRKVFTVPNDKGKTGTLSLLTVDDDYEIAMKRKMQTAKGLAEIKQTSSVPHAIYFETEYIDEDGATKTAKTILYGVTSGRPSQSYNQTTEDINNNNTDYSITIKGVPMKSGENIYKDASGNEVYVWQETCIPDDAGYATFGTTVVHPSPKS